ncbi:MAG: MBL fold metallo-hydrolase [Treponema sp.]|nr:MBL fold metallo-hydrolase [Spirochaetia bacterium]MDD7534689.1 MBL fold metallo-hydrolase [Treponema sp.]MDY5759260.1 MBL fold metallo-hydrolase [Treponema sp.]MDY5816955.1 MBL fold metallo-hydrolase [Treponema sp.]
MKTRHFVSNIELTNSGNLSLFFLGTGNAFTKTAFQTNLLIIKGQDHLLVDCGTLCSYAFENMYNGRITDIKNLLLTHPHADHIGGVEELALEGKYITKRLVNLVITDDFKKCLWEESLKGGIQYSEEGVMTFDDYFNQIKPVRIQKKPFEMFETNVGSINIKLFRTRHVTTRKKSLKKSQISYGLIIDDRILFTADTQFNPSQLQFLLDKYNKIEVIFHDCDVMGYSRGVHAAYDELVTLPKEIKEKTFLSHYSEAVSTIDALVDGFAGLAKHWVYYDFD